jgi:hypothetical protein
MMGSDHSKFPDFFDDDGPDPISAATRHSFTAKPAPKKKAGFYLSEELIDRFNRHFHQMKLAGTPIDNKSALLELALMFALEDLDKGPGSLLLKTLMRRP